LNKIEIYIKIELDRKDLTLNKMDDSETPNGRIWKTNDQVLSELKNNLKEFFQNETKNYFLDYAHEEIGCSEDFPIFDPEEIIINVEVKNQNG